MCVRARVCVCVCVCVCALTHALALALAHAHTHTHIHTHTHTHTHAQTQAHNARLRSALAPKRTHWQGKKVLLGYSWGTPGVPLEHPWGTPVPQEYSWGTPGALRSWTMPAVPCKRVPPFRALDALCERAVRGRHELRERSAQLLAFSRRSSAVWVCCFI